MASKYVQDISRSGALLEIKDVTWTPEDPRPGGEVRWQIQGKLREPVDLEKARVHVTAKLGTATIHRQTYDLPELMPNRQSPKKPKASKGPLELIWTDAVPSDLPSGDLRVYALAETVDGQEIASLDIRVDRRQ